MVTDEPCSDEAESLMGVYGLCLYPETFDVSSEASDPYDFDGDLQFLHNRLKSMVYKSPDKLREQAKRILSESSKSDNSRTVVNQAPMVNNEVLPVVTEASLRERRPGLGMGRKRARFSLNPSSSQLGVGSEPTLNIDELKDPEDFFKAYEQYDVAKREWHKLKGDVLSDSNQQNTSTNKRARRPGLGLSNRSVKYKHLYPSDDTKICNDAPTSQESFNSCIRNPDHHIPRESDQHITSPGASLAGSISEGEHDIDNILDELLSYNCEVLDENRAVNVLQERLKIKPIELEKLNLPDFHDIPKIDFKSSGNRILSKRRQTSSFADLLNGSGPGMLTSMKNRRGLESSEHLVTSPTPSKSPFSPLSLLNKRISHSRSSKDPFSAADIDRDQATDSSKRKEFSDIDDPIKVSETQKGKFDEDLDVEKSASYRASSSKDPFSVDEIDEDLATGSSRQSDKQLSGIRRQSNSESLLLEKSNSIEVSKTQNRKLDEGLNVAESASRLSSSSKDPFSASNPSKRSNREFSDIDSLLFENDDPIEVSETHKSKLDEGLNVEKSSSRLPSSSKDPVSASDFGGALAANLSLVFEDDDDNEVPETQKSKLGEGLNVGKSAYQVSGIDDGSTENIFTNDEIAQANENIIQDEVNDTVDPSLGNDSGEHAEKIVKEKRKAISKRGKADRRKSLAGAGTKWESGVRRSTRIKCRPLEYWNGERLLYGRIHKSLPTVIGLKYASPSVKGDEHKALKVRSFVGDEHKALLEMAAWH